MLTDGSLEAQNGVGYTVRLLPFDGCYGRLTMTEKTTDTCPYCGDGVTELPSHLRRECESIPPLEQSTAD